jgi:hypothetical protein
LFIASRSLLSFNVTSIRKPVARNDEGFTLSFVNWPCANSPKVNAAELQSCRAGGTDFRIETFKLQRLVELIEEPVKWQVVISSINHGFLF